MSESGQNEGADPGADFFDEVLQHDLANIIRKAQAGQPLTKREREIIEEEKASRTCEKPVEAGFKLEGGGVDDSLQDMTLEGLSRVWGYSLKTVKNWKRKGLRAKDPAPIRDSSKMCAWYERIYAPRMAPDKLRLAAQRIEEGGSKESVEGPTESVPAVNEKVEVAEEEKGLLAMLDRYRTAEVTLHNKYMQAVEAGDEQKSAFLLSEWSKMGEKVRALEKAAPKALEELRIYIRRDHVQRALEPLHASIMKAFRQGFRNSRVKLQQAKTASDWAIGVDDVVDEIARMLVETDFQDPLDLQEGDEAA